MHNILLGFLYILTLTALVTAIYASLHREVNHSLHVILLSLDIAFFALGSLLVLASSRADTAFMGFRIQHIGQPFVGGLWFLFTMDVCGYPIRKKHVVALLMALPMLMSLAITAGDPFKLFIRSLSFEIDNVLPYVTGDFTPLYIAGLIHIYGFNIASGVLILHKAMKAPVHPRMRYIVHFFVGLAPLLAGTIAIAVNNPHKLEIVSSTLCISSVLLNLYLFKTGVFKVIAKAKYQLFENMQDGIVIVNKRNEYIDSNNSAKVIFPSLTNVKNGTSVLKIEGLSYAIQQMGMQTGSFTRMVDNATKYYNISRSQMIEENRHIGSFYTFYDVTEIKIRGELLREAVEEAQAANKAKSAFLATMSHEIRTPLNAIIGMTQIQMQQDDLPDKYADAFEKIQNSGDSLLGIINDILDLSKIETGKLELNPVEYDIPSLVNDTMQLNAVRIGSKPIEFMLEVDENLPSRLFGDELRLKQILNNLLSNAVKYTDKGHIILSVSVKEQSKDDGIILVFSVSDTGQGMKEEDVERLFTEYLRFNTAANRSTEGTGLGLTITKRLLEMMNGDISVQSEYGTGSIFTVTITQKVIDAAPIGAEAAENLRNFTYINNKSKDRRKVLINPMPYGSVLIVDDVESNLLVAKGLLAPYRLKIDTADSGFEAIEKIENGNVYDIIFMDHMMPRMDGIEATKKIRQNRYMGVIVALTANALVGNEEKFTKNGFDGYISKPIDIRHLDAVLNKFIRSKYPEEAKKHKLETAEVKRPDISAKHMEIFLKEAERAVVTLRETTANGDIKLFTTTVHALKTSLNYVGEKELSQRAAMLEKAGHSGETEFIASNAESFIKELEALIDKLRPAETASPENADVPEDTAYLTQQLAAIRTACDNYDDKSAYAALDSLKLKPWKKETSAALEDIRDTLFLNSDFEEAAKQAAALQEVNAVKPAK